MTQNNVIPFPIHRIGQNLTAHPNLTQVPSEHPGHLQGQSFDIQNYFPKERKLILIEASKGTHQIPHKIFEFMFKATSTKVELIVFGCLIRYTLGFHRYDCKASHSFIAAWTGLAIPNIRKALDALVEACLIRRLQVGSSTNNSTVYEVPVVKGYLESIQAEDSKEKTQPLGLNQSQYWDQINPSTGINLIPKKDNTNKDKENTLSENSLTQYLEDYLLNLKPEAKKKREQGHFDVLRKDYSIADISESLKLLREKGIPGSKEKCHSPMGFLALSIENILPIVRARRENAHKKEPQEHSGAERRNLEAKREEEELLRCDHNRRLFEKAFPSIEQQEAIFQKFLIRYPFMGNNPFALKNAVISEWASQQKP